MKLIDRYVVGSVAQIALVTMLLCSLMLVSVDLFTNLDAYLQNDVPKLTLIRLSLYYLPTAVLFSVAPSLLFSVAFFLSQLQANNELICLFNGGISYRRIIMPLLLLACVFSAGYFGINEYLAIPLSRSRAVLEDELFGLRSTYDNRNITLNDEEGGYIVHAAHYDDEKRRLSSVLLVKTGTDDTVEQRVDAPYALWDADAENWILHDATVYSVDSSAMHVTSERKGSYIPSDLTLEPEMFRNLSADIKTMELHAAVRYLHRIRRLDVEQWHGSATDFFERILGCLTPLVLAFIACTISYRYKKNVLLFSIITSLSIAVIYYVVQMVSLILARQGAVGPVWGMVIPMIVIVCIAILERIAIR